MGIVEITIKSLEVERRALESIHKTMVAACISEGSPDQKDVFRIRELEGRLGAHVKSVRYQERLYGIVAGFCAAGGDPARLAESFSLFRSFREIELKNWSRQCPIINDLPADPNPFSFVPRLIPLAATQRSAEWRASRSEIIVRWTHHDLEWWRAGSLLQATLSAILDGASQKYLVQFVADQIARDTVQQVAVRDSLRSSPSSFWKCKDAGALARTIEWSVASTKEWSSLQRELRNNEADPSLAGVAACILGGRKGLRYLQESTGGDQLIPLSLAQELHRMYSRDYL